MNNKLSRQTNLDPKYAGFISRASAFFIDLIIVILISTIVSMTIMLLLQYFQKFNMNSNEINWIMYVSGLTNLLILILYFTICESSKYSRTIGKIIMKISIVSDNCTKLSKTKALTRSFVKLVSVFGLIGYITIPFSKKRKALHDFIMQTLVIKNDSDF